jgi:hypothetical protein
VAFASVRERPAVAPRSRAIQFFQAQKFFAAFFSKKQRFL